MIFVLASAIFTNGISSSFAARNNLLIKDAKDTNATHKVALLVSKRAKSKAILKKYENAHSLTDRQLVELLKAVGFKGEGLKKAWSIAKAESNGRPFAFNGNTKTGDSSYGIFQINMIGNLGPDRRDKFDLGLNAELFSPVKNAQVVFHMTKGGTDWSSWSSYKKGANHKWLKKYKDVVS
jgi:hypothetical protein